MDDDTEATKKRRTLWDLFRAGHDGLGTLAPLKRKPNGTIADCDV